MMSLPHRRSPGRPCVASVMIAV